MRDRGFSIATKRFAASRVNALVAGAVTFCILANCLVPKFSIRQREFDVLSRIMESQSSLLCFFSFSSLPMKIVEDLFAGERSAAQAKKKPAKPQDNSSNPSSDFSLVASDKKPNSVRWERERAPGSAAQAGVPASAASAIDLEKLRAGPPVGALPLFLPVLLFFFLFPRSSLPENAARMIRRNVLSRLEVSSRVFYLRVSGFCDLPKLTVRYFQLSCTEIDR